MKKLTIKCPTCSLMHDYYTSKPWSPFCSERCQLIDLGAWAGEEHRIKGEPVAQSEKQMNHSNDDNSGNFIN
ncbi:MAG: DNA gyrase inhibitor YacG [Gammaproteobacteria bacterium]|nr:DNA gyrase inhibitor YacG [Gammaproteobacteria bacterium]